MWVQILLLEFFTYSLMDRILDCESEDESSILSKWKIFYLFLFYMSILKGNSNYFSNYKNLSKEKMETSYVQEKTRSQKYLEDFKKEVFGKSVSKKEMLNTVIMLYGTPHEAKEKKLPHLRSLFDLPPLPDQEKFKNRFLDLLKEEKASSHFLFFTRLKKRIKIFFNFVKFSYSRISFFDNFVLFLSFFRSLFKFGFSMFFFFFLILVFLAI